jgi:hypothetical protein
MGKKQLKKNQKMQYHREFKTGDKSSHKKRKKMAGRKVK